MLFSKLRKAVEFKMIENITKIFLENQRVQIKIKQKTKHTYPLICYVFIKQKNLVYSTYDNFKGFLKDPYSIDSIVVYYFKELHEFV